MKNSILVSLFLTLSVVSCSSSCFSTPPKPEPLSPTTCDGGDCHDNSVVDGGSGGTADAGTKPVTSTAELVAQVGVTSVCSDSPELVCSPLPNVSAPAESVKGDSWQVNLPLGFQKSKSESPDIVFSALSKKDRLLVVLLKEKFTESFDVYVLTTVRDLKESGTKVVSTKPIKSGNSKSMLIETVKDEIKIWTMVTTKDGFGYALSCGGPGDHAVMLPVCTSITDSFSVNK